MRMEAQNLCFHYGRSPVLNQICMELSPGLTAVVGPNATGKTTLLKCLSRQLKFTGRIMLDGKSIADFSAAELSRTVSYLPQSGMERTGLTVFEVVLLGRLQNLSWRVSTRDIDLVESLLKEMSLSDLAGRRYRELSGGQAQMVALAQALIRQPAILLLDEPTSSLDLLNQFEVCSRVQTFTRSREMISVLTIHDLNLAARFADRIIVLSAGEVYSTGSPSDVLTKQMMAEVYLVDAEIKMDEDGRPHVIVTGPLSVQRQ